MNSPKHMSQSLFLLLLMFLFYQYMSLSMIKLNLYSIKKYKNKIVNRRVTTKSIKTIVNFLFCCYILAITLAAHFSKDLSIVRPTYYPYKDTNLIPLFLCTKLVGSLKLCYKDINLNFTLVRQSLTRTQILAIILVVTLNSC